MFTPSNGSSSSSSSSVPSSLHTLLGQPECRNPPSPAHPFTDPMAANFNDHGKLPRKDYTENYSATFQWTGNPCLDFFFHVVPGTPPESLAQMLEPAWAHHPLTTLKSWFHTAARWLFKNHPRTLACNVAAFAGFGHFKGLPEILHCLLEGPDIRARQKREELRIATSEARDQEQKQKASEKRMAMARKLLERYKCDGDFRFLHDAVSGHFALCLTVDLEFLKSREINNISLAAKWCPSLDSTSNSLKLLCESIAKRVFTQDRFPEVRDRLQKDALVPLRRVLELPEVYMSAVRWSDIPYNRVLSVARKLHRTSLGSTTTSGFGEDVMAKKATIPAGALLPHEIVASASVLYPNIKEVVKLQWKRMVEDLSKAGKLENCIAVCNVSGSMRRTLMEVSVALRLLVSELSREKWEGKVITFSMCPRLHAMQGDGLLSKTEFIRAMDWGFHIDFQGVFDGILQVATAGKLRAEEMVRKVFVFSDMEFDKASSTPWETDYEAITRKFRESGYREAVPQLVFWNLKDTWSTPVLVKRAGVALVNEHSKNLMKLFLEGEGDISPEAIVEAGISSKEHRDLVVVD
ncbi:hypothetical protein BT93_H3297 [Corymbia citriodora subsp. variegata]|nr:hypothetical protein BT93_H3297 [Corymbia citriodora subsp. variegata]